MADRIDGQWVVSPQDLVAEFECSHKVLLNAAVINGTFSVPQQDQPGLDLLREHGLAFERHRLEELESHCRVKRLGTPSRTRAAFEAAWQATRIAMLEEYDAIYQATLFTGDFLGYADLLILARDDQGTVLRDQHGVAIYEPVDVKSARSAKRGAALQVGAYAEALVCLGLPQPPRVHLWLAGDADWSAPSDALVALARELRERVQRQLPSLGHLPTPDWAPPREACARCRFADHCDAGRRRDRDLSLVQGIRSITRQRLVDAGMLSIDALAVATESHRPPRVPKETFERLRAQAAIQVDAERAGGILHEVINLKELTALPPRSPGDLWFDMEGDPYAPGPAGLEYMFGFGFLRNGEFAFDSFEADDRASERRAFEAFIDLVMQRWHDDPGMHVYHYAHYERRALERLAQQHGTREIELDAILRAGLLVDLYAVVRKTIRISTESLSLKYVEAAYGVTHSGEEVSSAMDSVIQYERAVALRADGRHDEAAAVLTEIRNYNRLDCESTMKLDDWLRSLVPGGMPFTGTGQSANSEGDSLLVGHPHADMIVRLQEQVPLSPSDRDAAQMARAALAAALQYHRREARPAWWKLFALIGADMDELDTASDVLLAHRVEASPWGKAPRARKLRRTLRIENHHEDPRGVLTPGDQALLLYENAEAGMSQPSGTLRGFTSVSVGSVSHSGVELVEGAGADGVTWDSTPIAVLPGTPFRTRSMEDALAAAADTVLPEHHDGHWAFPNAAWADLLLAREPRSRTGYLPRTGNTVTDICDALTQSDASYIAVQGPPGTGKTYVGSRAVAQLASQGWRIGVVAQSHAVVDNFLEAVVKANATVRVGKEPPSTQRGSKPWHISGKVHDWVSNQSGGHVIGGTAWTFTRPQVLGLNLDLLVIDEAGQFALANAIACAFGVQRVLLLGDPQQLPQVSQAQHPEGIEASVLEHVMRGQATIPAERGYFLNQTFRMHPLLTASVSALQYEGKLDSAPVTALRHLMDVSPGIIPVPVPHSGNTTASSEEADAVLSLVRDLMGKEWTDARDGQREQPRPLGQTDIIIVAAFNAQVRLLRRVLDDAGFPNIAVGTVDKFQGREAAVVIVSMATSSDEDLPRGIDFLLSPNRLNVAISRAEWACFLVHSPLLREVRPGSVTGMQRLGGFLNLVSAHSR